MNLLFCMADWFIFNPTYSGRDIQAQANQLAMDQGLVGFSATQGWLTKFRQRNFRLFRSDPTALKDPDEDLGSSVSIVATWL